MHERVSKLRESIVCYCVKGRAAFGTRHTDTHAHRCVSKRGESLMLGGSGVGIGQVTKHYVDESAAEARDNYNFGFYSASRAQIERMLADVNQRYCLTPFLSSMHFGGKRT